MYLREWDGLWPLHVLAVSILVLFQFLNKLKHIFLYRLPRTVNHFEWVCDASALHQRDRSVNVRDHFSWRSGLPRRQRPQGKIQTGQGIYLFPEKRFGASVLYNAHWWPRLHTTVYKSAACIHRENNYQISYTVVVSYDGNSPTNCSGQRRAAEQVVQSWPWPPRSQGLTFHYRNLRTVYHLTVCCGNVSGWGVGVGESGGGFACRKISSTSISCWDRRTDRHRHWDWQTDTER